MMPVRKYVQALDESVPDLQKKPPSLTELGPMKSAMDGSTRAQKEAPNDTVAEEMKSFSGVKPLKVL